MSISDGCRGGIAHQRLVEFLGNGAPYLASEIIGDCLLFPTNNEDGEAAIAHVLGTRAPSRPSRRGERKGGYYPDAAWDYFGRNAHSHDFVMAVEAGRLTPEKWPRHVPIVSVSFDGCVTVLNYVNGQAPLMEKIRDALQQVMDAYPEEWRVMP